MASDSEGALGFVLKPCGSSSGSRYPVVSGRALRDEEDSTQCSTVSSNKGIESLGGRNLSRRTNGQRWQEQNGKRIFLIGGSWLDFDYFPTSSLALRPRHED